MVTVLSAGDEIKKSAAYMVLHRGLDFESEAAQADSYIPVVVYPIFST